MHQVQSVSEKLMLCFARGLNFADDYFIKAHDISRPQSQTVCRLLHYFETPRVPNTSGEVHHRAGAHADWDFLTLVFQKAGQSGLEICPGREVSTSFGYGDSWTKVEPDPEKNAIGELYMLDSPVFNALSTNFTIQSVTLVICLCLGLTTASSRHFIE